MRVTCCVAVILAFVACHGLGAEEGGDFKVRTDRPRVMLTPERAKALAEKLETQDIPAQNSEDPGPKALAYALSGDEEAGRAAVEALMRFDIPEKVLREGVASDDYRWGAVVPAIYDWCHDLLTEEQRKQFVERYGLIAQAMNAKSWGGPRMPGSNYYNGYMRNGSVFGVAASGESPLAEAALNDALVTRWKNSSLPFYENEAKGGVVGEGSQYDRYNIQYVLWMAEALRTATGRDILKETNWFREWAYYSIYSTTPTLTYAKGVDDPYFQRFPFGDCEKWQGHPEVDDCIGDSMRAIALGYPDEKVGGHAQEYVDLVEPPTGMLGWIIEDGRVVDPEPLEDLPLDYYAPGAGQLFMRSSWKEAAAQVMLQLGVGDKGSHYHLDAGSFQMLRAARWMTKESTGYGHKFNGCTSRDALAHNTVLFNGRGQANAYPDGKPEVIALQVTRDYVHAAVDLTNAYRASRSSRKDRDDNPFCAKVVREFVYLKPDVLIIFDRMISTAPDVEKTFVMHFPVQPRFQEKREDDLFTGYIAENGGSQCVLQVVYPKAVSYKLVDEGKFEGNRSEEGYYQWRLEASQKGQRDSYFLTVVAALERFDLEPRCQLVEKDDTIGAIVSQPGRKFEVHFRKTPGDSLGRMIVDAAGAYGHSEGNLPAKVQRTWVDADGVHWGEPLEPLYPTDPALLKKK